ncbi:MAG TPA: ferrous iron transport protein B [Bdellovibrionota bacterium]|nr:ferrous iron transport protein B [Bdellovibrionota bacterium]
MIAHSQCAGAAIAEAPAPTPTTSTLLVGNPNVGKSAIFGHLTGHYAHVSNYPGTTVEILQGIFKGRNTKILDLPGTNSLFAVSDADRVARDALLDRLDHPGLEVIQVCDAKNLRRALFLTIQLLELEAPTVLVCNMMDEALAAGFEIDFKAFREELGVHVLGTVATQNKGLEELLDLKLRYQRGRIRLSYPPAIESALHRIASLMPAEMPGRRGRALLLLIGNGSLPGRAKSWLHDRAREAETTANQLREELGPGLLAEVARCRFEWVDRVLSVVRRQKITQSQTWLTRLGEITTHSVWGFPLALAVLYGIYLFVGVLGAGKAVDFLENTVFAKFLTPAFDWTLRVLLPASWEPFFIGAKGVEIGTGPGLLIGDYGLFSMALSYSVAIVLPIVGFFFIAFSILEDSGYLPRLAILLHRFFRLFGLNGQAVMPMVLGLGCDTMATITTRTLTSRKERIIVTLLLALAIPCSAQLGVILGLLAQLSLAATLWWVGTVVAVMMVVGFLAGKLYPGRGSDFILEIPPLRKPLGSNVLIKTAARIEWYLREAVPLFFLGTFILWFLDRLSALRWLQQAASPLVTGWLDLPAKATDAFLIGFLRRDYGAAGLYDLFRPGLAAGRVAPETEIQVVVAMVTMTLFIPCIANFFVVIKEHGLKTAAWMTALIFPLAFFVGGMVNLAMRSAWL